MPVIILSKADLAGDIEACIREVEQVALGTPVHAISVKRGEGIEPLDDYLAVGKTILINLGRARYAWVTVTPLSFLTVMTLYGGFLNIRDNTFQTYRISSPINSSGSSKGIELAYQQEYGYGFGLIAKTFTSASCAVRRCRPLSNGPPQSQPLAPTSNR